MTAGAQQGGCIIWFTGLPSSGKTTLAQRVASVVRERGRAVEVLDGDVVRTHLSQGLGFSKADRDTHIRRLGFVCHLLARHGVVAIAAAISPYRAVREEIRALQRAGRFVEIYTACALDTLMARDVKGLYKKALARELPHFTGVSDPYEPPRHPEMTVYTDRESPDESTEKIVKTLETLGIVQGGRHRA